MLLIVCRVKFQDRYILFCFLDIQVRDANYLTENALNVDDLLFDSTLQVNE